MCPSHFRSLDDLKKVLEMATSLFKKVEQQESSGDHQKALLLIMVNMGFMF